MLHTDAFIPGDNPCLVIGDSWIHSDQRTHVPVINPATEETVCHVPVATADDIQLAIATSVQGFETWRKTLPIDRSRVLRSAADRIRERADDIAKLMTLEQGKPLAEARAETLSTADLFEWFSEEARRSYGRIVASQVPGLALNVMAEPIGPVAAFTAWNFPMVVPGRKIAAAIAAGCSIIIKPSEETPLCVVEIARCLRDAGLPNGVLTVLYGDPAQISETLLAAPEIRKVAITGSTRVGKILARLAADTMKPGTYELGGHSPVLVFGDADAEGAAAQLAAAKYRNAGQVCTSPSRFFVHRDIVEPFTESYLAHVDKIVVGDGLQDGVAMGPLSNERQLQHISDLVSDAVTHGAQLAAGGHRIGNTGYFYEPTVLSNVPDTARIMLEEPFGPVTAIQTFDTTDDAIAKANMLDVGLGSYVFSSSPETMIRVAGELQAGMVGVNTCLIAHHEAPFGGVNQSGYGREGGVEGLEAYQIKKLVAAKAVA